MSCALNTAPQNLNSKFYPYLLGHPQCPVSLKGEIDQIFQRSLLKLSCKGGNIFEGERWVLKRARTDLPTTPDTHLYRIRKAEKVRTYILMNNLGESLVVPQKYLYWHETEQRFYVVSEKLDLSDEVPKSSCPELERTLRSASSLIGQIQAFKEGKPQRALTSIQAKALAEISILGCTDLSYNNFYFTRCGQIAIIDTEPHKRVLKKQFKNLFTKLLADKGMVTALQALSGIAKLKLVVTDPLALIEVGR